MSIDERKPTIIDDQKIIPVIEERLIVDKINTVTGTVDITKTVEQRNVDVPLVTVHTKYSEVRIPKNEIVEAVPEIRTENDVVIIPVIREEAIVVKRLVLVEEIHIKRETSTVENIETVELNTQRVDITRSKK